MLNDRDKFSVFTPSTCVHLISFGLVGGTIQINGSRSLAPRVLSDRQDAAELVLEAIEARTDEVLDGSFTLARFADLLERGMPLSHLLSICGFESRMSFCNFFLLVLPAVHSTL